MAEEVCQISGFANDGLFQELHEEMQRDVYWIRFFVRPCCPAPSLEGAIERLDKLKGEVFEREDLSDEQKTGLAELIETRKEWYPTSGLCRKAD